MITVEIPTLLRDLTGGESQVPGEGLDIRTLLDSLERQFPGFRRRFFDLNGALRNMVNIYVNEVDFHRLAGLDTPLSGGDHVRLAVAPLISGGSGR